MSSSRARRSPAAMRSACFTWRLIFFQAVFVTSKRRRVGATSSALPISVAARSASGSPKTMAATTDASTTLTGIPHLANEARGLPGSPQSEHSDPLQRLTGPDPRSRGLFQNHEQLLLQRATISLGTLAQPLREPIRDVLDREIHGHRVPPKQIHSSSASVEGAQLSPWRLVPRRGVT